ncbi:MAG: menaquinone biosynthesis protein [Bacteroidota bacterium]
MDKIRLAAVSYLNTKPLLYGLLRDEALAQQIELRLEIPSRCADLLLADEVDLALVPVAILPELGDYQLVSDFCIGSTGKVATVGIYADRPIEELEAIYLDHHSRTSVRLTQLLLEEYWQLAPQYLPAQEGYIDDIGGKRGGLVIGDRAMGLEQRFAYHYDLGEVWQAHTGLPFVFAAWVSRRPLTDGFSAAFNRAMATGIEHISELQYLLPSPHPDFNLEYYFKHNISYQLDAPKRQALERFLQFCAQQLVSG